MSLSPTLEEAIALLDDTPAEWRTSLAVLDQSGKLNEDDKSLLAVLGNSDSDGGGGVSGPVAPGLNAVAKWLSPGVLGSDDDVTVNGGSLSALSIETPTLFIGNSPARAGFDTSGLTSFDKTFAFPDKSGTLALTSDLAVFSPVGAVPDGVTDNRVAIQTAIDAAYAAGGGIVQLGVGDYRVQPTAGGIALLMRTGVRLNGAGEDATTISTDNTASVSFYNLIAPFGYNTVTVPYTADDLLISNLSLTGTAYTGGSAGNLHNLIACINNSFSHVENVGFGLTGAHCVEFNYFKNAALLNCSTVGDGDCGAARFQIDAGGLAGVNASPRFASTISGSATHASGTQVLLTVASTAGMTAGDHVVLTGANGAGAAGYNALGGYKIVSIPSATTLAIGVAWATVSSAATTAGTVTVQPAQKRLIITGYRDKPAAHQDYLIDYSFLELSHSSPTGVYEDIVIENNIIVPRGGEYAYGDVARTIGFGNGAEPINYTGLVIRNNTFVGGGLSGISQLINIGLSYSATYPLRKASAYVTGNKARNCGMYNFLRAGDMTNDTASRTTLPATALSVWTELVVTDNEVDIVLTWGGQNITRPQRIICIGSAQKATIERNQLYWPNVAPSGTAGFGWITSNTSNYGFFVDHVRDLVMRDNSVIFELTEGSYPANPGMYLYAYVFGCSAFELAASGPVRAHQIWENNSARGNGAIANGITRGFTELLTNGTTGVANWASATSPSVSGVWKGQTFISGGTPTVDTWSSDAANLNTPNNGGLTNAVTDASEATTWGRHDWLVGAFTTLSASGAALFADGATATPSMAFSTSPGTGFRYSASGGLVFSASSADIWRTAASSINMRSNGSYSWAPGADPATAADLYLGREGAAILRVGKAASATPLTNTVTIGESSRAGTDTNVGGGNGIISSPPGTGTGTVSNLIFQTPTVVASGTGAQTLATRLNLNSTGAQVAGALSASGAITSSASIIASGNSLAGATQQIGHQGRTLAESPINGKWRIGPNAMTAGITLDFLTADTLKLRNFADNSDGVFTAGAATFSGPAVVPSYTVATVPSAATFARGHIWVSDESGGATGAQSDATNWRRYSDRAIVT